MRPATLATTATNKPTAWRKKASNATMAIIEIYSDKKYAFRIFEIGECMNRCHSEINMTCVSRRKIATRFLLLSERPPPSVGPEQCTCARRIFIFYCASLKGDKDSCVAENNGKWMGEERDRAMASWVGRNM